MKKLITALMLSYSALSYAQPVKLLPINEERNAASGFAITHYLVVVNISKNCAMLSSEMKHISESAFKDWYTNNSLVYEASMGWVYYVGNDMKTQHGIKKSVELKKELKKQFDKNAMDGLHSFFPDGTPNVEKCKQIISLMNSKKMDIMPNKEFGKSLQEIISFHQGIMAFEENE